MSVVIKYGATLPFHPHTLLSLSPFTPHSPFTPTFPFHSPFSPSTLYLRRPFHQSHHSSKLRPSAITQIQNEAVQNASPMAPYLITTHVSIHFPIIRGFLQRILELHIPCGDDVLKNQILVIDGRNITHDCSSGV